MYYKLRVMIMPKWLGDKSNIAYVYQSLYSSTTGVENILCIFFSRIVTDKYEIFNQLRNCKIRDPSWSELRHFVNFLNVQLLSCEQSIFCSEFVAPDLPGFLNFVVQFMMQMSKVCSFAILSSYLVTTILIVILILKTIKSKNGCQFCFFILHKKLWVLKQ